MTSASELLLQLQNRVEKNSVAPPQQVGEDSWQGVAFLVSNERLLVNMKEISEVIELPAITSIPGVQPWIAGLANIRGVALPLVDLGLFLGREPSKNQARCHVISLDRPDARFGLIVDQIVGMRQVSNEDLESIDEGVAFESYLSGKVKIAEELWQTFDTDQLIFSDKFRQVAAA
ncbi:MAG: purine-binding chemotaxis protein CheW [Porticoccaceae bacterium]|jgi:twitching motility protein PilI|nr:purine-binding chemotaxis protein CheW [Porticoccaceae bacterium]